MYRVIYNILVMCVTPEYEQALQYFNNLVDVSKKDDPFLQIYLEKDGKILKQYPI